MCYNLLETQEINLSGLYVSAIALIILVVAIALLTDANKQKIDTRCIAFAGISVALTIALSFIKLFAMPQGGCITLASTLPLLLFAFIYGTRKGAIVGIIVGVLTFVADPYFVHPMQFLLDYIIPFSALGLAGMFRKIAKLDKNLQVTFLLGSISACIIRFICHTLSGVFAFSQFADKALWLYSMAYNSFVFIDIILALIIGTILLSSKSIIKYLNDTKKPPSNEDGNIQK